MNNYTYKTADNNVEKRAPSVWVFPWSTIVTNDEETPILLARDPEPTRVGRDNTSFIHVPGRRLFPSKNEYTITDKETSVNLPLAVSNILEYYAGLQKAPEEYAKTLEILHHEKSALFTGPTENREVICVSVCLGRKLKRDDFWRPKLSTEGGHMPADLDEDDIAYADSLRKHVWPIHFGMMMEQVTQHKPLNMQPFAPSSSPFTALWAGLGHGKTKKLQGTMLWALETLNEKTFAPLGIDSKDAHPTLNRWISNSHMMDCRSKLTNG